MTIASQQLERFLVQQPERKEIPPKILVGPEAHPPLLGLQMRTRSWLNVVSHVRDLEPEDPAKLTLDSCPQQLQCLNVCCFQTISLW